MDHAAAARDGVHDVRNVFSRGVLGAEADDQANDDQSQRQGGDRRQLDGDEEACRDARHDRGGQVDATVEQKDTEAHHGAHSGRQHQEQDRLVDAPGRDALEEAVAYGAGAEGEVTGEGGEVFHWQQGNTAGKGGRERASCSRISIVINFTSCTTNAV